MRIICTRKLRIICTPTNFVSYAHENCVLYACQTRVYHMTPKSIFAYQYHEFSLLFGILFIRIFMRLGKLVQHAFQDGNMEKIYFFFSQVYISQFREKTSQNCEIKSILVIYRKFSISGYVSLSGYETGYEILVILHSPSDRCQ